MDKNSTRFSREALLKAGFIIGGAALVWYLFSEDEEEATDLATSKNDDRPSESKIQPTIAEKDDVVTIEKLQKLGLEKVGDGTELADYVQALRNFGQRADHKVQKQGVAYIDMFGAPIAIISKPEYVRKTLAHNVQHALWGGIEAASKAFFGKQVLFVLEGDEWRTLRNTMKLALTRQNITQMNADVFSIASVLAEKMRSYAVAGKEIDMNKALGMFHLASVGKTAFNYDLGCMEGFEDGYTNEFNQAFDFMLAELPRRTLAPDQSVLGDYETDNEDNRLWKMHASNVRKPIMTFIRKRLIDRKAGVEIRNDLLDAMISAYEAEHNVTAASAEELYEGLGDNLVEIFFAGYNTSVVALCHAFYFLAKNPQWFAKLQKEIDAVIPAGFKGGETSIDTNKLKNCQNVFYESLRLVSPAPLVARLTTKPVDFDGTVLPPNTSCWFPADYLHKNKEHWGPDADEFNPDRWNNPEPCPHGAFIPFSGGPRECIGKHFAQLEAIASMAMLLKKYEFKVAPDYICQPLFSGFGFRPFDGNKKEISMRLIPIPRR